MSLAATVSNISQTGFNQFALNMRHLVILQPCIVCDNGTGFVKVSLTLSSESAKQRFLTVG